MGSLCERDEDPKFVMTKLMAAPVSEAAETEREVPAHSRGVTGESQRRRDATVERNSIGVISTYMGDGEFGWGSGSLLPLLGDAGADEASRR